MTETEILWKNTLGEATPEQLAQFDCYYRMLVDWNTRVNLTAITDPEGVAKKHFLDSLAALPLLTPGARCIDVGTGAGFPGVPLLILRPGLQMTLLDGLNKRLVFLEALLKALGLNATLVHARAEDAGRDPAHRGKYDFALTRAFAPLPVLLELTLPFLHVGGKSVAYKGDAAEELALSRSACHLLHCSLSTVPVPADYGVRALVVVRKDAPTPALYPRKAGTPAKKPL